MAYQRHDHYYHKAKKEGFLARSAYKLEEIQKRYKVLKPGQSVLDLGCAPGAWSQVALTVLGKQGRLVGIDLEEVRPESLHMDTSAARFIKGDIFELKAANLSEAPFHALISDVAPKTSGIAVRDQARSEEMCLHVIALADTLLKRGGNLVMKFFMGPGEDQINKAMRARFATVQKFRPKSTRTESSEIYIIGLGFRAPSATGLPTQSL